MTDHDRERWYEEASVRSVKPVQLTRAEIAESLAFSPELVPIATHPLVCKRDLSSEVLLHHLFQYLDFTVSLEHDAVNPVLRMISSDPAFAFLDQGDRLAAHRIMCDECFHAAFSAEFAEQVAEFARYHPRSYPRNNGQRFLSRLAELKSEWSESDGKLIAFLFAVVSETLITGTLTRGPRDPRVAPSVRSLLRYHARDEAQHHVYFSRLFEHQWHRLPQSAQRQFGELLPKFISIFLQPDLQTGQAMLVAMGFPPKEAAAIVDDSLPLSRVRSDLERSSHGTVALLRRNGVEVDSLP